MRFHGISIEICGHETRQLALDFGARDQWAMRPPRLWTPCRLIVTDPGAALFSLHSVATDSATAFGYPGLMELIFEVRDAEEGGFYARALGQAIFTEAENWDELRANVLEAVSLHFEDATTRPRLVQMHYVRDELIPVEAA